MRKVIHGINLVLFSLLFFLTSTQLGKHFFLSFSYLSGVRVDYLAPTLYLIDLVVLSLILCNIQSVKHMVRSRRTLYILALLALTLPFALVRPVALISYLRIVEMFIIFFLVKDFIYREKDRGVFILLTSLSLATGAQLVLSSIQFIEKHSLNGLLYFLGERYFTLSTPGIAKASLSGVELLRPYGTFSHPNSMGGFYLLVSLFAISLPVNEKRGLAMHIIRYLLFTLSSILVFFSFSKTAIITYVLLMALMLFKTGFYKRCPLCFSARLLVLFFVSLLFIQAQGDIFTLSKRIELSKNALEIIKQYPVTGVGLGNYVVAQAQFSTQHLNLINQPVHNAYLLLLCEVGLLVGGILFYELTQIFKRNRDQNVFLFCILSVGITALFDHYWLTLIQNLIILAVVFGSIQGISTNIQTGTKKV